MSADVGEGAHPWTRRAATQDLAYLARADQRLPQPIRVGGQATDPHDGAVVGEAFGELVDQLLGELDQIGYRTAPGNHDHGVLAAGRNHGRNTAPGEEAFDLVRRPARTQPIV